MFMHKKETPNTPKKSIELVSTDYTEVFFSKKTY